MRTTGLLLMAAMLAGAGSAVAADVELRVVSRDAQTSPPLAQRTEPCNLSGVTDNRFSASATHVAIGSTAAARAQGVDCDASTNNLATNVITVDIIGAPGATASLCSVVHFGAATAVSGPGDGAATAQVGGAPPSSAGGIFLNSTPFTTFQENLPANAADSDTQRVLLTATVGDQITLVTGAAAFGALKGAGAARSDADAGAAIYVGACPAERAPAATPWGLAGLATGLAAFGAAALRRRASPSA